MWYSCITTLAIWVYIQKEVVFEDISNPNTIIYKMIYLIKPVDEWSEIALSALQNAEKEHCEKLMKLENKLNFHYYACLYITLDVVFVYYYSSKLSLNWERGGLCRYF
jgi:hypothetical protein